MRRHLDIHDESGASIIELVIAVPIMLVLSCALIDGALMLVTSSQANSASTAAARTLLVKPNATSSELIAAAKSDAPALADATVNVSVSKSANTKSSYTHHFPSGINRSSAVTTQPETVTVTVERNWVTAMGSIVGGSNKLKSTSSSVVDVDRTDGTNW